MSLFRSFVISLGLCAALQTTVVYAKSLNDQLLIAVANNDLKAVKKLLTKGACPDAQLPAQYPELPESITALRLAAAIGSFDIVKELLKHGADPNLKNENRTTALITACCDGHSDIVELLGQYGADYNVIGNGGRSALMYATIFGHLNVVEVLLKHHADVNMQGSLTRETALIYACQYRQVAIVKILLEYGANPNAKDAHDRTPLSCAPNPQFGNPEIAELLKEYGAIA